MFDAFDLGDRLREETSHTKEPQEDEGVDLDEVLSRLDHLEELYRQASRPLYSRMNVSILLATIILLNMAVVHGVTNAYFDELLKYLGTILLPRGNMLPKTHYEAKQLIQRLGLNYDIIDACPSGYVLFRKENENLRSFPLPRCGLSRYIDGSNSVPARVIRWFPLIPRLLRMWRSASISKLLKYHTDFPNRDMTVMKTVAHSPAWEHVGTVVDPSFVLENRNVRFGLALDGVNPF
jgi:hypothetical protein